MRISDWSSDVCSSDLPAREKRAGSLANRGYQHGRRDGQNLAANSGTHIVRDIVRADVQGHVAADHRGDGDGQPVSTDRALVSGDRGPYDRQEDNGEPEGNDGLAKAEEQRLPVTETLEIADVPTDRKSVV